MINPYIIKAPVITERTLSLANKQNVYTFEVARAANKNQIKTAIEQAFAVSVLAVNTVMSARAKKKTGKKRMLTTTAKTKKALVKLKKGDSITLFDIGGEA